VPVCRAFDPGAPAYAPAGQHSSAARGLALLRGTHRAEVQARHHDEPVALQALRRSHMRRHLSVQHRSRSTLRCSRGWRWRSVGRGQVRSRRKPVAVKQEGWPRNEVRSPLSSSPRARRALVGCGLRPELECRASSEHRTPSGACERLRLLPDPQQLADLCDEAAHIQRVYAVSPAESLNPQWVWARSAVAANAAPPHRRSLVPASQ